MRKILIPGGSGLVGKILIDYLTRQGFKVYTLSRSSHTTARTFHWDPDQRTIDSACLQQDYYAIINTCGANIASKKWTSARKKELLDSRIKPTQFLWQLIQEDKLRTEKFLNLSATGIYGNFAHPVTELDDIKNTSFISQLTREWESAFFNHSSTGIQNAVLRLGVVLSRKGGFLSKFDRPLSLSVSPYFGNGKDYLSWIHELDLTRAIHHLIQQDEWQSIYNLTSPYPCTTQQLSLQLKAITPGWCVSISIPKFIIEIIFGEMKEIILSNTQALPHQLEEAGFEFRFYNIESALSDLYLKINYS